MVKSTASFPKNRRSISRVLKERNVTLYSRVANGKGRETQAGAIVVKVHRHELQRVAIVGKDMFIWNGQQ
jgi:hypothetical protein